MAFKPRLFVVTIIAVSHCFRARWISKNLRNIATLNLNLTDRAVLSASGNTAELVDNVHAIDDLAEDGVLAIEVRSCSQSDEELRAVGVWACVGHGEGALGLKFDMSQ